MGHQCTAGKRHFENRLYAAQVPDVDIDSWSGPMRKNDGIVMEMAGQTVPAEDVTGILDGMTYYGCIQDHFILPRKNRNRKSQKDSSRRRKESSLIELIGCVAVTR